VRPAARIVAVLGLLLASACGCGASEEEEYIRAVRIMDLLAALPKVKVTTLKLENVRANSFTADGQERDVIFMHREARVEFPHIGITKRSWLSFGIGINEPA